ncbi:hypothetical protein ACLB2K_062992 [Fragaria x ananassa]
MNERMSCPDLDRGTRGLGLRAQKSKGQKNILPGFGTDASQSLVRLAKYCSPREVLFISPSLFPLAKYCSPCQVYFASPSLVRLAKSCSPRQVRFAS